MREIKFRTRNKKSGVIEYVSLEDLANGNTFDIKFDDYEWVEYTGLKDKNGKEIYEGDIVSIKEHMNPKKEIYKQIVRWNEKDAKFEGVGFWPCNMAEVFL